MTIHARLAVCLCLALLTAGCVYRWRTFEVDEVEARGTQVNSPVKVHMRDGSVVVFRTGAHVGTDSIRGAGERFNATQEHLGAVQRLALDSVMGITNFRNEISGSRSALLSIGASAVGFVGGFALFKALFGSCPTFYTDSSGTPALEAEGFSYSIAPLFESRDLDALRGTPRNGVYRVEVRNEALETHYINHLELLAFEHPEGSRVLPDGRGNLTAVGKVVPPRSARDRDGRDALAPLMTADLEPFVTSAGRIKTLQTTDLMDHIDVDLGIAAADSVAVVIRLRNSLLTTVLLYEVMLARSGAGALDWIAEDLEQVGNAAELGKWYVERMGLRVLVQGSHGFREAGRIPDVGPIAWKDVAIMVPARKGEPLNVRIEFPADSWRIDQIGVAQHAVRATPVILPAARALHPEGAEDQRILDAVMQADDAYLITEPGRRVFIEFDVPRPRAGARHSFVLASQGYYFEWIRPDWVRNSSNQRFSATDESLFQAMQMWHANRNRLEQTFYATKLPVQ